MFLILTLALLPLGVVALIASLQAMRTADAERQSMLRMEVIQGARKLTSEIASDQMALRISIDGFGETISNPRQCESLNAFIRARTSSDSGFAIYDRAGRRLCSSGAESRPSLSADRHFAAEEMELLPSQNALLVRTRARGGSLVALVFYGRSRLVQMSDPAIAMDSHQMFLTQKNLELDLTRGKVANGGTVRRVSTTLGHDGILLTLVAHEQPKTLARTLTLFLPLLMWFAAAAIGWFVVNRLLIQPLVLLRRTVAAYQPGVVLKPFDKVRTPAQEITDLGETFRIISEDVASHEAEMAESLVRQRKLTREVHHRVKNNLQIIASLINLHSRSAATPEATDAYGSIQRRVDALSVVHRNHYAELEENRGVGIRPLVSELSASLRASAPDNAKRLNIQIDSADLHVSQDVAVPVAFLTTELVELAMLCDPGAMVRISIHRRDEEPGKAQLRVASLALRTTPALQARLIERFDRVLIGLSRQLRAPLHRDEEEGIFCIDIAVLD